MKLRKIYVELYRESRNLMTNTVMNNLIHQIGQTEGFPRIIIYGRGEQMLHTEARVFAEALEGYQVEVFTSGEFPRAPNMVLDLVNHGVEVNICQPHPKKREGWKLIWNGHEGVQIHSGDPIGGEVKGLPIPNPPRRKPCHYPFDSLTVLYNGMVKLCPHDPDDEAVIGNLIDTHLTSLWAHSKRLYWSRRFLSSRIRCPLPGCKKCPFGGKFDMSSYENYCRITQADVNEMRTAWSLK